ncbi:hypothetical protein F7725_014593 [Dissostichus mawsoni]|uniref:Uncharacterized protein n=1 Tax=Dissostichus mawsoni TaxID=36200 RepID=A0A7J5YWK5_DISMA|nr:hypothetical protein F7725_014593 [Dissostichus mawsoni]
MMPTLKYCTMDSLANFRLSNSEILDKITRKSNKRNAVIAERPEHRRDEQKGQYGSLIWEIKPQIPDLIRMGSPSQPWSRFLGSPIHNTACSLFPPTNIVPFKPTKDFPSAACPVQTANSPLKYHPPAYIQGNVNKVHFLER